MMRRLTDFLKALVTLCSIFLSPLILLMKNILNQRWRSLPPGPKGLPIIGNLHQIIDGTQTHVSLQRLANDFGPLMYLQLGSVPAIVVSSAEMAREIFKSHDRTISGRPVTYVANKVTYGCNDMTFCGYGDYWREVRKIVMLGLLRDRKVQSFEIIRDEELTLLLDSVAHSRRPINLSEMAFSLANNVICRAAFGSKYDSQNYRDGSRYCQVLIDLQNMVGEFNIMDFFPWLSWIEKLNGREKRLEKIFEKLDKLYERILDEHLDPRRPKPEHKDLVDILLQVQKDTNQGINLEKHNVKAIIAGIFLAGTEAASGMIVYTMAELIRNPSAMKKAQDEVRKIIHPGKMKVEESDLPSLLYLKAVVKETFRAHTPSPLLVFRQTTEDFTLKGYEIPSKTIVIINGRAIALDPNTWENPEEFQPKRFLNGRNIDFRGQDFELIPFGAGRRICPGASFATVLIEITVANLLHQFDWKLPDGQRIEDLDMEEAPGLTQKKKVPLYIVATPRN